MQKKYDFTGKTEKTMYSPTLHQIVRLKDELIGGWIESPDNLSQDGKCFVYDSARVYGHAVVKDDAVVKGSATVCGDGVVEGHSYVSGTVSVSDFAKVSDRAEVTRDARVQDRAHVYGKAFVSDGAKICGWARVGGNAQVRSNRIIGGTDCLDSIFITTPYLDFGMFSFTVTPTQCHFRTRYYGRAILSLPHQVWDSMSYADFRTVVNVPEAGSRVLVNAKEMLRVAIKIAGK